jgi:hypothetical protein
MLTGTTGSWRFATVLVQLTLVVLHTQPAKLIVDGETETDKNTRKEHDTTSVKAEKDSDSNAVHLNVVFGLQM